MVKAVATSDQNVLRVLKHLGVERSIRITLVKADRVFGWPVSDELLRHVVLNQWRQDPPADVQRMHGAFISFREPDVRPALQVVLHRADNSDAWPYFVELDLDENAPVGAWGEIRHGWELLRNAVTRRKTDQAKIAAMLDQRFAQNDKKSEGM